MSAGPIVIGWVALVLSAAAAALKNAHFSGNADSLMRRMREVKCFDDDE